MPVEAIGGIVIDEVSFIELGVFGHFDSDMRTLLGASEVLVGGMPLLFAGDAHQKPPPGATPWHQTMVRVAAGEGENPRKSGAMSAKQRGLALLCAARRVELKRLMRAQGDEQFIAHQRQMRRAADRQPVPDAFVRALRRVSPADVAADSAWRFAPIGVLSHVERDTLNLAQLHSFAREFDLPVVRWRLPLVDDAFTSEAVREELYEHEPNLWGYFVEGAPAHLLETIKSVRKLVNGSPVLLDSLQVKVAADREALADAYAGGYDTSMVTLSEPPEAVNVVVGGTKEAPRLWHEVPLDDLSSLIPDYVGGAQVVPILLSPNAEDVDCYSLFAAQQGIAQKIRVKCHQYGLAFCLTDFKLQGRTLPKLILSICKRQRLPWMTLASFYVLISRVREAAGLRLLQHDREGLALVAELQGDEYLHAWECGYDADGCWDDARAASALRATREAREAAKKAERLRKAEAAREAMAARRTAARPPPAAPPPAKRARTAAAPAAPPPAQTGQERNRTRAIVPAGATKRQVCGTCGKPGHTRPTCRQRTV